MKEVEVHIEWDTKKMSDNELEKLFKIEKLMRELGVTFDTGFDLLAKNRDWEWDSSLEGPVKVMYRCFVKDNPK